MHVKVNKTTYRGKEYFSAFLVKSHRTSKGPRHEVVFNFGGVSRDEGERLKRSFQLANDPESIIAKRDEFHTAASLSLADICAVYEQFKPLGINAVMECAKEDHLLKALVINRCVNPQSKIGVVRWYPKTVLPALTGLGVEEVNKNSIYGVLSKIEAKKETFEKRLYETLANQPGADGTHVYIDWTSSYFEGSKCEMAAYGFSKDHRPDKKQVMLTLALKGEHPFYWQVHEGNASEVNVFEKESKHIKEKFGLKEVTFVFDRGPVSDENLKDLEARGIKYISALDKPQIHTTIPSSMYGFIGRLGLEQNYDFEMKQKQWRKYDDRCYFKEAGIDNRRHILLWNPEIFERQRAHRNELLEKGKEFLRKFKESLNRPASPTEEGELIKSVSENLIKLEVSKYFKFEIRGGVIEEEREGKVFSYPAFDLKYEVNKEALRAQEREDGLWCIVTNHVEIYKKREQATLHALSSEHVISAYRNRYKIEAAFKHIKDILQLRPIYVYKPEHVKAHYTICVLSYAIDKRIDNLLPKNWTAARLYEALGSVRLNLIGLDLQHSNNTFAILPKIENQHQKLLKNIGLEDASINRLTTCDYNRLYNVVTK